MSRDRYRARPTTYKGIEMRSRLEAGWSGDMTRLAERMDIIGSSFEKPYVAILEQPGSFPREPEFFEDGVVWQPRPWVPYYDTERRVGEYALSQPLIPPFAPWPDRRWEGQR